MECACKGQNHDACTALEDASGMPCRQEARFGRSAMHRQTAWILGIKCKTNSLLKWTQNFTIISIDVNTTHRLFRYLPQHC